MISTVFNTAHHLRAKIPSVFTERVLAFRYYVAVCIAVTKGVFFAILGRCLYEEKWRPLLVGPTGSNQFEQGSRIRLLKRRFPETPGSNFDVAIKEVSTLGVRVHWKYMNPRGHRPTTLRLQKNSELGLGPNVSIMPGAYISVWAGKSLIFEEDVATGTNLFVSTKCGLTIRKGTMIGHDTVIMDYDGHPILKFGKFIDEGPTGGGEAKQISIGKNVWIGFRSVILKGVNIGDGAIIGANSIVTKDVPPFCVAAGNPARIVAEGVQWKWY